MIVDTHNRVTSIDLSNHAPDAERRVDEGERLSRAVMVAMADAQNCDVHEILPPLHESVDLDALDDIFGPQYDGTPRTGGRVVFVHGECDVVVEHGFVRVYCE